MTGVPVRNPEDGTDAWLSGITPVQGWSGRVTAAFSPVRPGGKDLGLLNTINGRERWSERQRGPDAAGRGGQHTRHAKGRGGHPGTVRRIRRPAGLDGVDNMDFGLRRAPRRGLPPRDSRRDGEGHLREHALQAGIQRNQSGPPLPLRQGGH